MYHVKVIIHLIVALLTLYNEELCMHHGAKTRFLCVLYSVSAVNGTVDVSF